MLGHLYRTEDLHGSFAGPGANSRQSHRLWKNNNFARTCTTLVGEPKKGIGTLQAIPTEVIRQQTSAQSTTYDFAEGDRRAPRACRCKLFQLMANSVQTWRRQAALPARRNTAPERPRHNHRLGG
jgi:hypothetical protein